MLEDKTGYASAEANPLGIDIFDKILITFIYIPIKYVDQELPIRGLTYSTNAAA